MDVCEWYTGIFPFWPEINWAQSWCWKPIDISDRAVGVGAAGAAAAGPIICSVSLASCWILQFHPKIAPETISEGLKFKIFLGEGPLTPPGDALRALATLLGWRAAHAMPLCRHDFIAQICKALSAWPNYDCFLRACQREVRAAVYGHSMTESEDLPRKDCAMHGSPQTRPSGHMKLKPQYKFLTVWL